MAGQDRFIVSEEPFSKRGPLRTMPITIGGVPKDKLLEQVKAVRYVSPYAERIMKHKNFTTLEKPESALLIVLTPKDFGFTQMAYVADLLDPNRLVAWSKENLDGWEITIVPAEVGPHLAIQYTGQPQDEFLWMAMDRIPGYAGRPYLFYIERDDEEVFSLDSHWMYPAAPWPLHYSIAFRLRKVPPATRPYPRDMVGYGPQPPNPRWPNDARLAVNFVLNFEEGSEPSFADGDGFTEAALTEAGSQGLTGRDLAAESQFEYGSRIGFWRIHRIFQERSLPLTVFACALALERNPPATQAIARAGYDVCCHGWRWEKHYELQIDEERERIHKAVASITHTIGARPLGWYCRYSPSVNTRRLLVEEGGFLYDSDCYNDELPYWTFIDGRSHLVVPYTLGVNDSKYTRAVFGTGGDFFAYAKDAFDVLLREGATHPKMLSVGMHLRITGHPSRAAGLERFLDYATGQKDVWVCRREQIARHWVAQHPAPR